MVLGVITSQSTTISFVIQKTVDISFTFLLFATYS